MKTFVCLVAALASVAVAAPTDITQKNLGGVLPVTSGAANHQAGSFSNGAQQASSNAAQGSFGYDHAAQAAKAFGNKESSGSRENFAHSSSNAFNHGSGSSSHDSGFNNNAHLANLGHQQASTGSIVQPGLGFGGVGLGVGGLGTSGLGTSGFGTGGFGTGLPVGAHSSLGSLQQGSSAAGASKGHNAWNVNQGQSSVKSTGNKESFSNKESFGQEASSSHAKGNGQNSQSQSAQQGHHNQGQQVSSANQGSSLLG